MQRKKLLVISGGGVFGCIPARFMCHPTARSSLDNISCYSGSSIGSILSTCYASGISSSQVLTFFLRESSNIFPKRSWWRGPKIFGSKHSDKALNEILEKLLPGYFGDVATPLFIPAYDIKEGYFKVFDNIRDGDGHLEAWVPARASVSAPTYLPIYEWLADGGLAENIPVMTALTGISRRLGWDWKEIDVLAIGTGYREHKNTYSLNNINNWWTPACWLNHIIRWLTECNEAATVGWATTLANSGALGSFKYFNPVVLEDNWDMDDATKVIPAIRRAENYIEGFGKVFEEWMDR